jgi:hypothetical protein
VPSLRDDRAQAAPDRLAVGVGVEADGDGISGRLDQERRESAAALAITPSDTTTLPFGPVSDVIRNVFSSYLWSAPHNFA